MVWRDEQDRERDLIERRLELLQQEAQAAFTALCHAHDRLTASARSLGFWNGFLVAWLIAHLFWLLQGL